MFFDFYTRFYISFTDWDYKEKDYDKQKAINKNDKR